MLLIIRSAIESARLSLLRGSASENASRFNSRKPFQAVSRTSPRMLPLSIDGPNVIAPSSRPPIKTPSARNALLTVLWL
ncbi:MULTISPECIES: hypothetical protein [unclassified Bradyrhizobium]|uniref:hypothetical protein n=1 Tax=unclassified Bradyrhizobium TaxID=2631580 RepID=UPI00247A8477|nr:MULTISPECIES: hypothetical protein [unclassified Bradyrhizobium]WGS18704.1 hypothetical protein MTX22_29765 [Bradyrhizobium sp. ISRA463]WGS25529.1 hypothetical protein MTX19_27350 [Bradyrhizobium sp. ISRA464]